MSAAALLTAPARAQNAPGFFVDDDADDRGAIALTQLPRRGLNSYCQKSAVVSEIRAYVFAVTADKLPADWTYRQQMRHMEVFDVQNLTTTELDINRNRFSCHGVLVLENNQQIPGTYTKWLERTPIPGGGFHEEIRSSWTPDRTR